MLDILVGYLSSVRFQKWQPLTNSERPITRRVSVTANRFPSNQRRLYIRPTVIVNKDAWTEINCSVQFFSIIIIRSLYRQTPIHKCQQWSLFRAFNGRDILNTTRYLDLLKIFKQVNNG